VIPVTKQSGHALRTMLLLIETFDTITGIFILTEARLVLLRIELRFIIPQFQFVDVHCKRGVQSDDFVIKDVEKVHRPSSTASETSSKARPSRFWVVMVVVRAGIVEKSQSQG